MVNIIDEHTREALVMHAARSIDADALVARLDALVARRGRAPRFVRMDNGPELTSHALRDWCRFSTAGSVFIEPGCPWQNPFVESFHARVRDELLNGEQFACIAEARVLVDDWREDYNQRRPHSLALGCARRPRSPPTAPRPLPRDTRGRIAHRSARPRARLATAIRPAKHLACLLLRPLDSHSQWTEERGPSRPGCNMHSEWSEPAVATGRQRRPYAAWTWIAPR